MLVSSAEKLLQLVGTRSGPTKRRALSDSNLFDTQMVLLKENFEKLDFEKKSSDDK